VARLGDALFLISAGVRANAVAPRMKRRFADDTHPQKGGTGKDDEMRDVPGSCAAPDDSPKPPKPLKPMRGAFPTPKPEIEQAEPYIPEPDEEGDQEGKPDQPDAGEAEEETEG
jgi:hypothetical protein